MPWVCTSCGERFEEKTSPCLSCAGEEIAFIEQESTDLTETPTQVTYQCRECGREYIKNNPPL